MKTYLILFITIFLTAFQPAAAQEETPRDSLSLSPDSLGYRLPFMMAAPGFDGCSPWFYGTYAPSWVLHEGFNAQLSMSMMAGWGKGTPSGVGFGQSATFAYALPLSKRFSLAAGLYTQNLDWGCYRNTDVGLAATLGYRINDRVSVYAYATKSFLPQRNRYAVGCYPWWTGNAGDRIGAMAEFKIGKNASIQVGVERRSGGAYPALPYLPVHPSYHSPYCP